MTPEPFRGQNAELTAPGCDPLPVMIMKPDPGITLGSIVSVWRPSSEERALIAAGAPVMLTIIGTGHPPVAVGVFPLHTAGGN